MRELPLPGERTKQVIALADKVARQPLPLRTRILLPAILLIIGIGAFWFGLRDDQADPGTPTPTTAATVTEIPTSVVFTAPP